jgi:hypothetical protein
MRRIAIGLVAMLVSCGEATKPNACLEGEVEVVIKSVSDRPPPSGVIATFLQIDAERLSDHADLKLYVTYLGDVNRLPPENAVCQAVSVCDEFSLIDLNNEQNNGPTAWRSRLTSLICNGDQFVPRGTK